MITKTISQLNDPELILVTDSQDVFPIKDYIEDAQNFDAFFVKIADGDYTEIWGFYGIVPNLDKIAYKLK